MADPIPLEAYYDLTLVTEVALSPDGDRLAYVADEFDREADDRRRSLFAVPTDGSRGPHRLTRVADATGPKWSPDGRRLGVLAARETDVALAVGEADAAGEEADAAGEDATAESGGESDDASEEEPRSQLWTFDLERGGDARQVTDFDEGVREFDWGPDGDRVVASVRDPTEDEAEYLRARREDDAPVETERLQHKFDGHGWLDTVTTYLFVVDVEDRETRRLDEAYGGGAYEPWTGLSPVWGEERIAFLSNRTDRPDDSGVMDVYTVRPDGTGLERATDGTVAASRPSWDPAGERLAFAVQDPEEWFRPTGVAVADPAEGTVTRLTDGLDRTLDRRAVLRWATGDVVAPFADEAHTRLARLDPDGARDQRPEWLLDGLGADRSITAFDLRGGTAAVALGHPAEGLDVHAVAVEELSSASSDAAIVRLTATNDEFLDAHHTPRCERVRFENDGWDLAGLAYLPPGFDAADPDPRPVVVSIHGGPLSYDAPEFRFEYAALTSRGYLVFCPNYRGGASFGQAFAETLWGRWGTVEVDDVVAGVEALVERGWADPERVFGRGFSYGAIAQGHLVTRTDLFAAAAPEHGIYDLRSEYGTSDSHVWTEAEFGLPWEDREPFEAASSITDVGEIDTPLLVMAGGQDWRCPPSQSEQLYVSVKKQGVPAKLVVYPDEHHDVGDPARAVHRLEQLTSWFAEHDPGADGSA